MNSPPRPPPRSLDERYLRVQQEHDPRARRVHAQVAQHLAQLPVQAQPQGLLPLFGLGGAPPPNIMTGKVNLGLIDVPVGAVDPIAADEIHDGDQIVRIFKSTDYAGKTHYTYIGLVEWQTWVAACAQQGRAVVNPETNLPVTAEQVDIYTAHLAQLPNAAAGGARRRRHRLSTRRSRRARRSTRRRKN